MVRRGSVVFISVCSMAFFGGLWDADMRWMTLWSPLQQYGRDTLWLDKRWSFSFVEIIAEHGYGAMCISHVVCTLYFTGLT